MAKKALKKATTPTPEKADPGPFAANRDHYLRTVVRLVRRQLDCARRGLIGSEEWFKALEQDFRHVERYSLIGRFSAPEIRFWWAERTSDPPGEIPARWHIQEGIPTHRVPGEPPSLEQHCILGELDKPATIRAVNLLATHVLQEWLEWIETAPERDLATDMMPAAYFEPIRVASAENLRKWRDAGKIVGTKAGSGREVLYSITSVLKHLRLPVTLRDKLDAKWIENNIEADERKGPEVARNMNGSRADFGGLSRHTRAAPR
jgi:hypothetical protein